MKDDIVFGYRLSSADCVTDGDDDGFSFIVYDNGKIEYKAYIISDTVIKHMIISADVRLAEELQSFIDKNKSEIEKLKKYTCNGSNDGSFESFTFNKKTVTSLNISYSDIDEVKIKNPKYYEKYYSVMLQENYVMGIFEKICDILKKYGILLDLHKVNFENLIFSTDELNDNWKKLFMKDSRLIIVEGLPASEKSTKADIIARTLKKMGKKVVCINEGVTNHPVDCNNYDFPDFETERMQILSKWKELVDNADSDTVYVFNCVFMQNPISETMLHFGMSEEESGRYICEIADIIRPMNPSVVYFKHENDFRVIFRVLTECGIISWFDFIKAHHKKHRYGKQDTYWDIDEYIDCVEERQKWELNILPETTLDYVLIDEYNSEVGYYEFFAATD